MKQHPRAGVVVRNKTDQGGGRSKQRLDVIAIVVSVASFGISLGGLWVSGVGVGIFENPRVTFTVDDVLGVGACFAGENVEVIVYNGKQVVLDDWLTVVSPAIPHDQLAVTVPGPGSYSYELHGNGTLPSGSAVISGGGADTFDVTHATHRFLVVSEPDSKTDHGVQCPSGHYPYHLRFNHLHSGRPLASDAIRDSATA